jgi:MFS family permease
MWLTAAVLRSYALFVGAMFVNGLFSGTKSVMMSYFADVYTPEEFGSKQPIFGMFLLTGGTAGGIFGGIFIAATGSLWMAAWVGIIASVVFAAAVSHTMPSEAKAKPDAADAKKTDAAVPDDADGPDAKAAAEKKMLPATVRQILMICIFAGALDSLGDEGNRFARSTIMPQTYPVTKDPSTMSLIGSSNVLATAFCMFLVMGRSRTLGLSLTKSI